jgi:uncharacterized protein (TIGR02453 family)
MQYFTQDFLDFFIELAANNHKDWFHENKKRYEKSVKEPFDLFVKDLISEIKVHDPELDIEPKDCVMRINRDIRFAADKTPYNLHRTAIISRTGRKDKSIPGIYLRFSPENIGIMGGCYGPSSEQLGDIRSTIAKDLKGFQKLISMKGFVATFGEIRGDANKRVPKELQAIAVEEPLILNKQFYYVSEHNPKLILADNLMEQVMEIWHVAQPVNEYFYKAFSK